MIKLGIQSAILGDLSFDEVVTFASDNGFACVEMMCWPQSTEDRRYAGVTHINVTSLDDNEIIRIKKKLKESNIFISGLGYYPNPLDHDTKQSGFYIGHIMKVIEAAAILDVGIMNTFIGADPAKHDDYNFDKFREVWPPIIQYAEKIDVVLWGKKSA